MQGFFRFGEEELGKEITRTEAQALKQVGAHIRMEARDLLVRRAGPSEAGQPPHVHSKDKRYTLRFILYFYDRDTHSLVVGPVGLNRAATVPRIMEEGGNVTTEEILFPNDTKWTNLAIFKRPTPTMDTYPHRTRKYRVKKRPFMSKAYEAALPRIPDEFASALGWGG